MISWDFAPVDQSPGIPRAGVRGRLLAADLRVCGTFTGGENACESSRVSSYPQSQSCSQGAESSLLDSLGMMTLGMLWDGQVTPD